jgi:hypothetical protein
VLFVLEVKKMKAVVHWSQPAQNPKLWSLRRGLYAYFDVDSSEMLYIGKVYGTSVRQRWCRSGKRDFWDALETERGIYLHGVIVGEIELLNGNRLTKALTSDIESLLINRLQPWGNIQCRNSRITREGLDVLCRGEWRTTQRRFIDN